MENNSLQIEFCFTLSHWLEVSGKVLNLCSCWATVIFCKMDPWGIAASSMIMMITLWTVSRTLHNLREVLKYCWRVADSLWKPVDRAGKSLGSCSIPWCCGEQRWTWFVLENKNQVLGLSLSSAVALLLALKIAPVMFCVADGSAELGPPCCWIPGQFSSKSCSSLESEHFERLWMDRECLLISEIKYTFLSYLIFLKWAWNQLEAQPQISLKAESHSSVYTKLYFLCCWFPKCFIMLPWEEAKLKNWCQAEKQDKLYDFWVLFAWLCVENKFSLFAHLQRGLVWNWGNKNQCIAFILDQHW